jgi:hypothetical protein
MADITITAANVLSTTSPLQGIAGAAIAQGDVLYKDTADGNKLKLADANGAAATRIVEGIAVNAAAANQPVNYVKFDTNMTIGGTTVAGTVYVLSENEGKIAPIGDVTTAASTIAVLGVGLPTNKLYVSILNTGAAIPTP